MFFTQSSYRNLTKENRQCEYFIEQDRQKHRKFCLGLVFFMLLASILLSLTVLVVLALSNKVVMKKTDQPIACLPCTKIVRNPMDLSAADPLIETLSRRLGEDDEELCCAYDSAQMSALLEMTMRRQEVDTAPLQEYNVSSFQFSPVSAHKRLYPPVNPHTTVAYRDRVPQFDSGGNALILFKHVNATPDERVEHARGVEVLNDGLRIAHSGLYYIYSSIHFRPESGHLCKDFKFQTWGHTVVKTRPNDPANSGCLLKTLHTCCDECSRDQETSYTGGVFHFKAGDVINIYISGHGLAYFRPQTSFAGLLMLGSPDQ